MKKIALSLSLILVAVVTITSCKNDLNVFSPGKELVSVYGIINTNEPVQNIRINKVFLTEGDANVAATDNNTINYDAGELTVTLERYNTGSTVKQPTSHGSLKTEIILTETVITTPSGAFGNQQRVYQTTDKLYHTGEYKLIIRKTADLTTVIASAQTVVVDSVSTASSAIMPFYYIPSNPSSYPNHGQYNTSTPPYTTQSKYVNYSVPSVDQTVKIKSVLNAKTYDLVMRFHYVDSLIGGGTIDQSIDFNFNAQQTTKLDGSEFITTFKFNTNDFYTNTASEIAKKATANVKNRKADYLEYIVSAGTESLFTFLQVNAPSTTIAQDKPSYSNITNGVGIFASRSTSIVTKDLWADFLDKLACYPSTFPYLFCDNLGKTRSVTCP